MGKRKKSARQAAVDTKIKNLEDALASVRAELSGVVLGALKTMKARRRCPACGEGRLLHIPAATELTKGGAAPLAVHHTEGFWGGTKSYGPIEHFICRTCFLIESHAIDLDGVEADGETVIAIEPEPDPEPAGGPYR